MNKPRFSFRLHSSNTPLVLGSIGFSLILIFLLFRTSPAPTVLGLYSTQQAVLIVLLFVGFMGAGALVLLRPPLLGRTLSSMIDRLADVPLLLELLILSGAALLGGWFLFDSVLDSVTEIHRYIKEVAFLTRHRLVAGGLVLIYMALVLGVYRSMMDTRALLLKQRLFLVFFGVLSATIMGEIGLRTIGFSLVPTRYSLLPENIHWEFHPAPGVMPGIEGTSIYTTNSEGIRGDTYPPDADYTIIAVGGSTTQDVYLDDSEAWPYLMQGRLNRSDLYARAWVGNVGRSGHGMAEHILTLRYFIPQFEVDAVISMVGINDLSPALRLPEDYSRQWDDPSLLRRFWFSTFYQTPWVSAEHPYSELLPVDLYVGNLLAQVLGMKLNQRYDQTMVEDQAGIAYVARRRVFQEARGILNEPPDLSLALNQFKVNLAEYVDLAEHLGVRLILTTQPVIWSDHLSAMGEALIHMGYYGFSGAPQSRYSVEALAEAMTMFNDELLDFCRENQVECVDLAALMSGDELYFYDDVHFNEQGAERVADLLADYLLASSSGRTGDRGTESRQR